MIALMAPRDDPDTVPPPAGEDDAYSAATRVGAMPPEVLAQLRAEGGVDEPPREVAKPTPPPVPRPPPVSAPMGAGGLPSLADVVPHDSSPPTAVIDVPTQLLDASGSVPPRAPTISVKPAANAGSVSNAPPVVETPVAFAAPESAAKSAAPAAHAPVALAKDEADQLRAFGRRSNTRMRVILIAGMVTLVAFAFIMALLSQRG
jgi:hypothetical protein